MSASQTKVSRLIGLGVHDIKAAEIADGPFDVETGISAAGTVITDATDLTRSVNIVATCASNAGVQLPVASIGKEIVIANNGSNAGKIWPHSATGTINGGTAGASVALTNAKTYRCIKLDATDWHVVQLN